jgi:MFS family permease
MASLQMLTVVTISGALVAGMALALFGCLKRALAQRGELWEGAIKQGLLALNVALIPIVLLCGVAIDNFGTRPVLILGSVALALGLFSLGMRLENARAFAALLFAAFGAAAVSAAVTVLMPRVFFSPTETSASVNLGYVFIALGALITPVLADVLLHAFGERRTLGLLAVFALVPGVLAVFPAHEHWPGSQLPSDPVELLFEQSSWLAALVFFVYAPLEASLTNWTLLYLAERGQDERHAVRLLAGFWVAFLSSRLLAALAQHTGWLTEMWDRWLIVLPPLLAAIVIGNMSGAGQRGIARSGLWLLGFLLGPVFPTLVGMGFRRVHASEQGLTYGLIFAAGSLGSLALAPLTQMRPRESNLFALRLPMFFALAVTAGALILGLTVP